MSGEAHSLPISSGDTRGARDRAPSYPVLHRLVTPLLLSTARAPAAGRKALGSQGELQSCRQGVTGPQAGKGSPSSPWLVSLLWI